MKSDVFRSAFEGSRCLVTGGAGFIGSNLTRELLQCGALVTVVDDFSTGRRDHLPAHDRLRIVEGDLVDYAPLESLTHEADYIFHLAAQVGNVKSIGAPVRDAESNIISTVRLIDACRHASVKRIVYSSSSAIFGEARSLPIDEAHPHHPASFYALSKLTGERYVRLASELLALPTVCLRYFNVYGLPMEDNEYTGVISIFLRRLDRDQGLTIYGDGEQLRDFIHVSDVVQANLRAAFAGTPGAVYNIGTGIGTTIRQLAEVLSELTFRSPSIDYADFRAGEVRKSVANIGLAQSELGFAPRYTMRTGLGDLLSGRGPVSTPRDH